MAAQTRLQLKGKGSAFTTTDLSAREVGVRTDAGGESIEFEDNDASEVLRLDPILKMGVTFKHDTALTATERVAIFQTNKAITVRGVSFASAGGTSIVLDVEFGTSIGAGTVIHTDTCATATPEYNVTPSGTTAVPASRIITVELGTVTGSVTQLHVTVYYTIDA